MFFNLDGVGRGSNDFDNMRPVDRDKKVDVRIKVNMFERIVADFADKQLHRHVFNQQFVHKTLAHSVEELCHVSAGKRLFAYLDVIGGGAILEVIVRFDQTIARQGLAQLERPALKLCWATPWHGVKVAVALCRGGVGAYFIGPDTNWLIGGGGEEGGGGETLGRK